MASKTVVVVSVLAVIVIALIVIVAVLATKRSEDRVVSEFITDDSNNSSKEDWWCETSKELPCSKNGQTITRENWTVPFLDASVDVICMDINKRKSNTFLATHSTTYNERVVMEIKCIDDSIPCISEFKICIQDHKVPLSTLHCKFLKDFHQTETEEAAPISQNATCGAIGAKNQTYIMDTGFNITKFDFNSEWIVFEKAIPETEPT